MGGEEEGGVVIEPLPPPIVGNPERYRKNELYSLASRTHSSVELQRKQTVCVASNLKSPTQIASLPSI